MSVIAMGVVIASSLLSAAPEDELGEVGESCRSRADCRSGLKCLANVCSADSKEGTACGATRECGGGGLRCLEHVCRFPAAAQPAPAASAPTYVPPPPPEWGPPAAPPPTWAAQPQPAPAFSAPPSAAFQQPATVSAPAQEQPELFEGTHGYVGGTIGIGPGSISGGGASGGTLGIPLAARGGAWFGRFDLQFELAPFTDFVVGRGVIPMLGLTAKPGLLLVMHQRGDFAVGWMFRLGAGVGVIDSFPAARINVQLLGIGVRSGRLHMEFALPIDAYLGALSLVKVPLTFAMTYVF